MISDLRDVQERFEELAKKLLSDKVKIIAWEAAVRELAPIDREGAAQLDVWRVRARVFQEVERRAEGEPVKVREWITVEALIDAEAGICWRFETVEYSREG